MRRVGMLAVGTLACAWALGLDLCGTAAEPSSNSKSTEKQAAPLAKQAPASPTNPTATKPASTTKAPERRLVTVGDGQVVLDVRQWPLIGKPDAKYVFVEMFDYTCPYCRARSHSEKKSKKEVTKKK